MLDNHFVLYVILKYSLYFLEDLNSQDLRQNQRKDIYLHLYFLYILY